MANFGGLFCTDPENIQPLGATPIVRDTFISHVPWQIELNPHLLTSRPPALHEFIS